jgi:hypothetical protein
VIAAGAPHDAVARWCIDKLLQKQREAPNLDGPVGVITDGAEITQANEWQLAFNQAGEAFPWLLMNGDEGAVTVLADACFASDEACRHNPIVAKFMGLSVPLSQQFWGHVIGRPAGRAALYARAARGDGLGSDEHFLPGEPLYRVSSGLWEALAERLTSPLFKERRVPSEHEMAEAGLLLAAFEKWMAAQPPGFWRNRPELVPWADPAMRPAKVLIVLCAALHMRDVTEQLQTLLRSIVDDANPHEKDVLVLLGVALGRVCERPGEPSEALLALAATPQVASLFAQDMAGSFWAALLRRFGVEAVIALADALALADLGLGFFDALASNAPEALDCYQMRPDLLRAGLVRSTTSGFVPSSAFHEVAWHRPRHPEEIRDLDRISAGDWLRGLIEQSRRWPDGEREAFLRWLAQRSRHAEVRQRCLQALRDTRGPEQQRR